MRVLALSTGIGSLSGAILLVSCAATEPQTAAHSLRPAQRHAVHSDKLRSVMTDLSTRAQKTWPQEIADERQSQADRDRDIRFQDARKLAAALAEAAGQISGAIEGVNLTDDERNAFMAGVGRLRAQAGQLESSVTARDLNRMRTVLNSIRTTCNHCHAQFRELAGTVNSGELQLVTR